MRRVRDGMNPSEIFINRPIATSLLMAAIGLFGVVAYRSLPVSDLPTVDFPTVQVQAGLPGADPGTMASTVASPLERQFTAIAGIDSMISSSTTGASSITLQFALERPIDSAAVDVQTAVAAAMPLLPAGLPAPPTFRKQNPAVQPVIFLGLTSTTASMPVLNGYAESVIAPRVSMIGGVSQVQVMGAQKFAVRVQVDPDKLRAQDIALNDVDQAVQNWNVNLPTGQLFGPAQTFNVKANGQLPTAEAYKSIVVRYANGRPIRLEQVAHVIDDVEDNRSVSWFYSRGTRNRAISMSVLPQPGSNVIDVVDRVRAVVPLIEAQLPPSVHLAVRGDRSGPIRAAFQDIQWTMAVTLLLVVGVIYLFLHNGSATLIPALALPFSILGTFAVMQVLGYSLNNLSMMALILSVGFVVDDAIVMLENIVRRVENGESAMDAALKGSSEITFTILTMTTSLAAVFIPILFMSGILGRLFREFAVTITAAILISGVVSITLTPMLCSRFLRIPLKRGRVARVLDQAFDRLSMAYQWSLGLVLDHRLAMLCVFVAVLAATVRMYDIVPKGFIPDQDNDSLMINLRAAQGTSYYEMAPTTQRVGDIVQRNPNVDSMLTSTGGGQGGMNQGLIRVSLIPRRRRQKSAQQIAQELRRLLVNLPNVQAFVSLPPALQIGGRVGDSTYSVTVRSPDTSDLFNYAQKLSTAMSGIDDIQDVSSDLNIKNPEVALAIDRDKAAALGLNATELEATLASGYGQRWSSTIYGATTQYKVLLEVDPHDQQYADSLDALTFRTPRGGMVPLQSVLRARETVGPLSVNHSEQLPAVAISFGLRPGVSLGTAVDRIRQVADAILPATMNVAFEGSAKVFQQSTKNLNVLLLVAIGVVYIVLGALYESYVHPITILSGLPSAGLGALVTLWLFGNELNIYSFVGLIMLVGIVKKNAIMQIDFALDAERRRGLAPVDAIYEGCLIRFRPIMMTTMAALLGTLPIALGLGAGGEARRPLGLAVVGGLLVSQALTLYLTPAVYSFMATWFSVRKFASAPIEEVATTI